VVLTVQCMDQPGIVKAVADEIYALDGNITDSAQFSHPHSGQFLLRTEIDVPTEHQNTLEQSVRDRLASFDPILTIRPRHHRRKVLLMVSATDHCLREVLYHWKLDELPVDIVGVVSNHETLRHVVEEHNIPFHYRPVTQDNKAEQEAFVHEVMRDTRADFIVLARYMQILSEEFCARYPARIINIHHSFLPGFKGAKPYHQAYERGVKLIGATAHYVTSDLDEGPIIDQDVVRVSHRSGPLDLVRTGRDVERRVLNRAIRLHAEDRVLLAGDRTVVFD
jgi:formyltetrahydrofolate deformylase